MIKIDVQASDHVTLFIIYLHILRYVEHLGHLVTTPPPRLSCNVHQHACGGGDLYQAVDGEGPGWCTSFLVSSLARIFLCLEDYFLMSLRHPRSELLFLTGALAQV